MFKFIALSYYNKKKCIQILNKLNLSLSLIAKLPVTIPLHEHDFNFA